MSSNPPKLCAICGAFQPPDMRSSKEHRRLWKIITLAEQYWPEQFEYQPEGKDYIRQWLTVKAGQYTFERHDIPDPSDPMYDFIVKLMRSAYNFTAHSDSDRPRYVFEKITGPRQITLYQAKKQRIAQ